MARLSLLSLFALCLLLPARAADKDPAAGITVDKEKRTVSIDAKIAPRKLEYLKGVIYPIEVVACWPHPKGEKAHETILTFESKPSEIHKAVESLGLKPGIPVMGETKKQSEGPEVNIYIEVPRPDGTPRRLPVEKTLIDPKTNKPMPKVKWRFTGSVMTKPDPAKDEQVYGADRTGTLIAMFPVTNQTVFQTNLAFKDQDYLKMETNKEVLPAEGTPVKLVIEVPKK
jgi:hypothetical protein